jgi:hypothetical protein
MSEIIPVTAMTSSREELLRLIAELSGADPELRLGQMLTNLATLARGPQSESVWDCEDDEFVSAANRLLARLRERHAAVA